MTKVTKKILKYPRGYEPDFIIASECNGNRFALGKKGSNPLVAICMNPSAAEDNLSDATANRIISISQQLGNDGWMIFNTYPERATDASNMDAYDSDLLQENIDIIEEWIRENNITEVWGAWVDLKYDSLRKGRDRLLSLLKDMDVKVFHFGTLTKKDNPRHPLQRFEKWFISDENKNYLY